MGVGVALIKEAQVARRARRVSCIVAFFLWLLLAWGLMESGWVVMGRQVSDTYTVETVAATLPRGRCPLWFRVSTTWLLRHTFLKWQFWHGKDRFENVRADDPWTMVDTTCPTPTKVRVFRKKYVDVALHTPWLTERWMSIAFSS